mgnify:CR=1 FL=1
MLLQVVSYPYRRFFNYGEAQVTHVTKSLTMHHRPMLLLLRFASCVVGILKGLD